jgi:hypothetical protein
MRKSITKPTREGSNFFPGESGQQVIMEPTKPSLIIHVLVVFFLINCSVLLRNFNDSCSTWIIKNRLLTVS